MSVRYSVVIPVFNGERVLPACLEALARQTVPAADYEIVVVDDGSTDGTAAAVARYPVRLIRQTNAGPASARNAGVELACGDIVLFTDADCRPQPDWLASMVAPFAQQAVSGVQGAYTGGQSQLAARFAQVEFEERYARLAPGASIDFVFTYSAAYRRAVFVDMHGFDVAFPAPNGEDLDLGYRMVASGYRLVFAPAARVQHLHPTVWRGYFRQKFTRAYWRQQVYARFPAKAVSDVYTPLSLKLQIALAPLLPATPLLGRAWVLAWTAGFLASCGPMLRAGWRTDRSLVPWVPLGCLVRAVALGAGVVCGLGLLVSGLVRRPSARGAHG